MISCKDITIFLLLNQKIKINEISWKILSLKNKIEEREVSEYYDELFENIVGKYFKCLENKYPTYSYILDGCKIVAKRDNNIKFFLETGVSYQVRDLVLDLITGYEDDLFKDISKDEKKQFRKEDDILYGKLAEKIQRVMKSKDYLQLVS